MSRAHAFKDRSRATITLPSGLEVVIRKLDQTAMLERGGPLLVAAAQGEGAAAAQGMRGEDLARAARVMVTLSLVDPPVWEGPQDQCPEDHIVLADLGEQLWPLLTAIREHNGLTPEAAEAAASFHEKTRGGAGPDSAEIPSPADGDPEAESV